MANENAPFGLRPLFTLHGGPPLTDLLSKIATYGTAIFRGDAVNRAADGSIEVSITPGTTLISGVSLNWGAVSTLSDHFVVTDPTVVFEAQSDGSLVAADMGLNANLVLTAGNATTKRSKHQVNSASENTTNSLDVRLRGKTNAPDNAWGAYVRLEIQFNNHRHAFTVTGV